LLSLLASLASFDFLFVRAFSLVLLLVLAALLLLLLPLLLLERLLLVLFALLGHGGSPGVSHLLQKCSLLLLSLLLVLLRDHDILNFTILSIFLLCCGLFLLDFGHLFLKTLGHIVESLVLTVELDLKELFNDLLFDLIAAELIFYNLFGHVWNDKSNQNLESDDSMLDKDSEDNDVCARPKDFIFILEPLRQDRLLRDQKCVQILTRTDLHGGEAADKQNDNVDRDSKVRDEAHDGHPVSNTARALSDAPSPILSEVLKLDSNLQQIRQEGEERGEGERHREESDETELDDGLVVVEDKCGGTRFHHELLLDVAVHLQIRCSDFITSEFRLSNRFCEEFFNLANFPANLYLLLEELK